MPTNCFLKRWPRQPHFRRPFTNCQEQIQKWRCLHTYGNKSATHPATTFGHCTSSGIYLLFCRDSAPDMRNLNRCGVELCASGLQRDSSLTVHSGRDSNARSYDLQCASRVSHQPHHPQRRERGLHRRGDFLGWRETLRLPAIHIHASWRRVCSPYPNEFLRTGSQGETRIYSGGPRANQGHLQREGWD